MPKVTVFMPVYNSSSFLKKSIESILNQSYKDFELLIIDDGSTDDSLEIIKSFNDYRIRLFKNEVNKGLPYTRNRGLELARGEYFAIMDSDDIAFRNRLKQQVNYLEENKEIDIVTSDELVIYKGIPFKRVRRINNNDYISLYLLFDNYIGNTTVMFRKKISEKIRYNEECFVCQDYEFWINLKKNCKFASINKPLVKYRTGHNNITRLSNTKKRNKRNEVLLSIRLKGLLDEKIKLNNEEMLRLNNFLDYKNTKLKKFDNIGDIFLKIINEVESNNITKGNMIRNVVNDLVSNHISICNDNLKSKLNILTELNRKIISIDINGIRKTIYIRHIYNKIKNKIL